MEGWAPTALAGGDVLRWGAGAVVCFPWTNARLLATIQSEPVGKPWNKTIWNPWLNVLRWKCGCGCRDSRVVVVKVVVVKAVVVVVIVVWLWLS